MFKRIVLSIVILSSMIFLLNFITASAESTDIFKGAYMESLYSKCAGSPAEYSPSDENIDLRTGNLQIFRNDLTLPGVNGLDFELNRFYDLSSSDVVEPYATYNLGDYSYDSPGFYVKFVAFGVTYKIPILCYQQGQYMDLFRDFNPTITTDASVEYNYYNEKDPEHVGFLTTPLNVYGIGTGWSFDFPWLETINTGEYLHFGSAGLWKVDYNNSKSHLKGYSYSDVVFDKVPEDTNIAFTGIKPKYVISFKDGKKNYLNELGRILAITDKFDNKIEFFYQGQMIDHVVDTAGRVINFEYTNGCLKEVKVEDTQGSLMPTMNPSISFKPTLSPNPSTPSPTHSPIPTPLFENAGPSEVGTITPNPTVPTRRITYYQFTSDDWTPNKLYAVDNNGVIERYRYEFLSQRLNLVNKDIMDPESPDYDPDMDPAKIGSLYCALVQITSPMQETRCIEYESSEKNCGRDGFIQFYKVKRTYSLDEDRYTANTPVEYYYNIPENQNQPGTPVSPAPEYDGYPNYPEPDMVPDNFETKTIVENASQSDNSFRIVKLNKDGLETEIVDHGAEKNKTQNIYVNGLLAASINSKFYGDKEVKIINNYRYNDKRDVTQMWDQNAKRGGYIPQGGTAIPTISPEPTPISSPSPSPSGPPKVLSVGVDRVLNGLFGNTVSAYNYENIYFKIKLDGYADTLQMIFIDINYGELITINDPKVISVEGNTWTILRPINYSTGYSNITFRARLNGAKSSYSPSVNCFLSVPPTPGTQTPTPPPVTASPSPTPVPMIMPELHNPNISDEVHKTVYTYDSRYSMLVKTEYHKDANTIIKDVSILDSEGKNEVYSLTFVNDHLKSKTGYLYDNYGNMTDEITYLAPRATLRPFGTPENSPLPETLSTPVPSSMPNASYSPETDVTHYNYGFCGDITAPVYLLKTTRFGIELGEELIEESRYDFFGNVVESIDEQDNKAETIYDDQDRVLQEITYKIDEKEEDPEKRVKPLMTTNFYDDDNNIQVMIDNMTQVIERHDNFGNGFGSEMYSDEVNSSETISFDDMNNRVTELKRNELQATPPIPSTYPVQPTAVPTINPDTNIQTKTTYLNGRVETETDFKGNVYLYTYGSYVKTLEPLPTASTIPNPEYEYADEELYVDTVIVDETPHSTALPYEVTVKEDKTFSDNRGNVVKTESKSIVIAHLADGTVDDDVITQYNYNQYDDFGLLISSESWIKNNNNEPELISKNSSVYDYAGRVIESTDMYNNKVITEYDINGNVKYSATNYLSSGDLDSESAYEYDKFGRVMKESTLLNDEGDASLKEYEYDKYGNVKIERIQKDSDSVSETHFIYDQYNQLTEVSLVDDLGRKHTTKYEYDLYGQKTAMMTGYIYNSDNSLNAESMEAITQYEYNSLGQLIKKTDPNDVEELYFYNQDGNLVYTLDANANIQSWCYNDEGKIEAEMSWVCTNKKYILDKNNTYTYTDISTRIKDNIKNTVTTTTYEASGNVDNISIDNGYNDIIKDYTYNSDGMRENLTVFINDVEKYKTQFTYDSKKRLKDVKRGNQIIASYSYDDASRVQQVVYGPDNIVTTNIGYDKGNRVESFVSSNESETLNDYSYSYYLDDQQESKVEDIGGANKTTSYSYDHLGRLVNVKEDDENILGFTYDARNNRKTMSVPGEIREYQYDKNDQIICEFGYDDGISYDFDKNGNQIYASYENFTDRTQKPEQFNAKVVNEDVGVKNSSANLYNSSNQLIKAQSKGVNAEYAYGFDGLRNEKKVNGEVTKYVWDGDQIILELDGEYNVNAKYYRGLSLICSDEEDSEGEPKNTNYYLYNAHGDVTKILDDQGDVLRSYEYDAFGNQKSLDEGDTNPFRFSGEYFDKEMGTIYLRARYYNPSYGRFITEDSYTGEENNPLSLNLYTYCYEDPINLNDQTGHWGTLVHKEFFRGFKNSKAYIEGSNFTDSSKGLHKGKSGNNKRLAYNKFHGNVEDVSNQLNMLGINLTSLYNLAVKVKKGKDVEENDLDFMVYYKKEAKNDINNRLSKYKKSERGAFMFGVFAHLLQDMYGHSPTLKTHNNEYVLFKKYDFNGLCNNAEERKDKWIEIYGEDIKTGSDLGENEEICHAKDRMRAARIYTKNLVKKFEGNINVTDIKLKAKYYDWTFEGTGISTKIRSFIVRCTIGKNK